MKNQRLNIRLEDDEREKLEEMSKQTGLTFTEIFRQKVLGDDLILDQLSNVNNNVLEVKEILMRDVRIAESQLVQTIRNVVKETFNEKTPNI